MISTEYGAFLRIYTDGSKISTPVPSTSAAMYIPEINISQTWKLEHLHSVLFAELYALFRAFSFVLDLFPPQHVVFFTDSLSSLKFLQAKSSNSYRRIYDLLQRKISLFDQAQDWNVHLVWIPSHVGIGDNEIVDAAARLAHNHLELCDFSLELPEIMSATSRAIREELHRSQEDFLYFHPTSKPFSLNSTRELVAHNRRIETSIFLLKTIHKIKWASVPAKNGTIPGMPPLSVSQ